LLLLPLQILPLLLPLQYCSTSTPCLWPPGAIPWLKPCRSCHSPTESSLSTANCTHEPSLLLPLPFLLLLLLLPLPLPALLRAGSQATTAAMRQLATCLAASSLSVARLYRCKLPLSSPSSTTCRPGSQQHNRPSEAAGVLRLSSHRLCCQPVSWGNTAALLI
jgi:hypothetical protein